MRCLRTHRIWFALLLLLAPPAKATEPEPNVVERYEIERRDVDEHEPRTLRFLRANRAYLRTELDRLQSHRRLVEGEARPLSERDRMLLEHQRALAADGDSLAAAERRLDRRELMRSVAELTDYEATLDSLETLVAAQEERLARLGADYARRQETALALFLRGPIGDDAAAVIVEDPRGDEHRLTLDETARAALQAGASAQLLHEFVEPRPTELRLRRVNADGTEAELGRLALHPTRHRLTLMEVELDRSDDGAPTLRASTWER